MLRPGSSLQGSAPSPAPSDVSRKLTGHAARASSLVRTFPNYCYFSEEKLQGTPDLGLILAHLPSHLDASNLTSRNDFAHAMEDFLQACSTPWVCPI